MAVNFHPMPLGSIVASAVNLTPEVRGEIAQAGWLFCEGQALPCAKYPELFALLGHAHGQANGGTSFLLPDLRGRFLRGVAGDTQRDPDVDQRRIPATGGLGGGGVGSVQEDAFRRHSHAVTAMVHNDAIDGVDSAITHSYEHHNALLRSGEEGGAETRPVNVYVHWLILAGPPAP